MPVVFVIWIVTGINQSPVCISTGDRHIHAAKGVHDLAKAAEIYHGGMIDADAQIVEDRVFQQARSPARVANGNSMLISGVDALIPPLRDRDPQVTRDRNE